MKYRPPATATLLSLAPSRRYPLDAFLPFAAPEPAVTRTGGASARAPGPIPPDDAADRVLAGCAFLRWAREQQAEVPEPLWYAALTNLAVLPSGDDAAWECSHRYPGFSERELAHKLAHARDWGRPTSCTRIHGLGFGGCPACPWWGRVRAPAGIAFKRASKAPGPDAADVTPASRQKLTS